MPIPSSSTYFRIQEAYLFPVVEAVYNNRQEALLFAFADETVFLCGDGQCDSQRTQRQIPGVYAYE